MTNRMTKLAGSRCHRHGAVLHFFDGFSKPTWALEQSIEALRDYRAIHLVGVFQGETVEVWARANKTASTSSHDVWSREVAGRSCGLGTARPIATSPARKTVYFEPALTIGILPWLGPELLETLRAAENTQVIHGKDPATGRSRVTLLCSLMDANGAAVLEH